jgi:hypothetical protein
MMNDLDKIIASLRFLNLKPNMREYKWRFLVQKIAHLAQSLGLQTRYYFTIYVAGPYSSTLTRDYYGNQERINSLETEYQLTPDEQKILEKIGACCNLYEDMLLMECTSTVVYLMKENPNVKDGDIIAKIHALKPYLGDATCVIGISKAKELLFKPEYLTQELKREIDAWSKIDLRFSGGR